MPILFDLDQWSHTCGPPDVFVHPAWLSIISFIIIMSEILTKFVNITTISKHNFNFKRQKSKSRFIVALWTCMILKGHCYFQLVPRYIFEFLCGPRTLFFVNLGTSHIFEFEAHEVNFTNIFAAVFIRADLKSAKRQSSHQCLFALLGSAARKTLVN